MSKDGKINMERGGIPIETQDDRLCGISHYLFQYLILLYKKKIQIVSIQEKSTAILQDLDLTGLIYPTAISPGGEKVFFGGNSILNNVVQQGDMFFYCLIKGDEENLIKSLLRESKIEEALDHVRKSYENPEMRKSELQKTLLSATSVNIKNCEFKKAKENYMRIFFDPREFVILFPQYLIPSKKFFNSTGN